MKQVIRLTSFMMAFCLLAGCGGIGASAVSTEPAWTESAETRPGIEQEQPVAVSETQQEEEVRDGDQQMQTAEPEAETIPEPADEKQAEEPAIQEEQPEETPKIEEMPMYFQSDYPDTMYANGTVASCGCSITSLAMVAAYLTGYPYTPDMLADYFGGYIGNHLERLEYASDQLQLPWRRAANWHDARQALWDGEVVIAMMNSKSIFTDSQHFIVIYDVTEDGKFLVRDSAKSNYSKWNLERAFEEGFADGDISCGYGGAWIYEKSSMPEEPFIYTEPEKEHVEPRYPDVELTEADKELLARMVWVEAQGEPFEGQQAIAEVVLNRVVADNFPDTLRNVVMADGQFRSTQFLKDAEPTQTQYEAIEQALYGPYVLPIDVVFFAQFAVNKNVWGTIGGHTFCYQWD